MTIRRLAKMQTYSRNGQIFPYDERVFTFSRKVELTDLMREDSPEPNDDTLRQVRAAADKHFNLLQRREFPKWYIHSIEMVDPGDSNLWRAHPHEAFRNMTLTDLVFRKWYNEHPDEMVTYFRPAGIFRKEYKEPFVPFEIPNQSYVTIEFVCTLRTRIEADYV